MGLRAGLLWVLSALREWGEGRGPMSPLCPRTYIIKPHFSFHEGSTFSPSRKKAHPATRKVGVDNLNRVRERKGGLTPKLWK